MEPILPVSACSDDSVDPSKQRLNMQRKSSKGTKGDNKATVTAGAPVFLRKTYDMINTCDPEVASWFDNGTTFVVKDPDRFATEVIPKYFKHNNFSSFVRQLNFYGFRKIKSDPLRLKDAETSEESKWWKFRHEKFVQGRPECLLQIKKHSNTSDAALDRQDVEVLKSEVRDLKAKLSSTVDELGELKAMIHSMKKENDLKRAQSVYLPLPAEKKRRTSLGTVESWLLKSPTEEILPVPVPSEMPPAETPSTLVDGPNVDDEMLAYISALDATDGTITDIFASENMPDMPLSTNVPDEKELKEQAQKLEDAFSKIPSALRSMFVDRLVALVSDPEEFKKQVDAATKLALAAAEEAGTAPVTDESVRFGAAILGAYLSRLGSSPKTAS